MKNLLELYYSVLKQANISDREYQLDFLTNKIYQNPKKPIVLGAGTSSGKTVIAILKLIMFFLNPKNKNKQCLVVPAFQEILRDNFVEQLYEIESKYGDLPFSYKIIKGYSSKQQIKQAMKDKVNVIICLPVTINNHISLFENKIEWLYFDEAQYFYLAKMCQDMVKKINPKYQLLMTGSVAKYNADSDNYLIKYVAVSELHRLKLISNPRIELVQSAYNLKDADYKSMFGKLKDGKTNNVSKNTESLHSVAKEMVLTLKNRFPNFVTNKYYGKRAIRIFGDIDKTIMICHSIPQAECFYKILKTELKGKVLISHSKTDKEDWDNFSKFKTDDSKLLIVVNQGRIGYSMKELFNIVDFSMSKDFENIQQIVGRLLRVSDLQPNKQKIYYKVSTVDLAKWYEYVMRCVMCLMRLEWYSTYTGDKKQFKFPYMVRKQNQPTNKLKLNGKTKSNNKFKISEEFPLDLNYVNYVEQNMKSEFATYAWWELKDVLNIEFGIKTSTKGAHNRLTKNDIIDIAKKYKIRKEFFENDFYAWTMAYKNGYLDEVCSHMKKPANIGWDYNKIKNEALKYNNPTQFKDASNDNKNMYQYAIKKGWDKLFSHFKIKFPEITKEDIIKSANQYNDYTKWGKECPNIRAKAVRMGIVDEVTSHMKKIKKYGKITKKYCKEIALKYSNREDFKKNHSYIHGYSRKMGWYDSITKHMPYRNGANDSQKKKVIQKDFNGNIINIFESLSEACRTFNGPGVQRVIYGKRPSYNGFIFEYEK